MVETSTEPDLPLLKDLPSCMCFLKCLSHQTRKSLGSNSAPRVCVHVCFRHRARDTEQEQGLGSDGDPALTKHRDV